MHNLRFCQHRADKYSVSDCYIAIAQTVFAFAIYSAKGQSLFCFVMAKGSAAWAADYCIGKVPMLIMHDGAYKITEAKPPLNNAEKWNISE